MEQKSSGIDSDFSALVKNHIRVLAESIKISTSLPVGTARTNFTTCFPDFNDEIKPYSEQLEQMMSTILKCEGFKADIRNHDSEDKIDLVVDGVNRILERVKRNVDELNGIAPLPAPVEPPSVASEGHGSWNTTPSDYKKEGFWKRRPTNMPRVHVKPQLSFKDKVDNSETPFKPGLKEKPNAIRPLQLRLEKGADGLSSYNHPYMPELKLFTAPQSHLRKVEPQEPWDVKLKPEIFIDTVEEFQKMLEDLRKQTEIAVDLEHHDYRSFQGFTCLMQISTRKDDYIIDTLALRSELHQLNEVFTNPAIVKVLHGADLDIEWLQKDLNLYVVNMFDTFFASLELNFRRLGLAYLLEHYCDLKSDKQYQLYDWRIRPLAKAAQEYARSDTHYLLYVYDKLRNDLIDKGNGTTVLLENIFTRAAEICKKRYEKPHAESGFQKMLKDTRRTYDNRQIYAFRHLYMWRDAVARKEDESYRFVLPNHMLYRLIEMLPRDKHAIMACCVPLPIMVKRYLNQIYEIISDARRQPLKTSGSQHFTNSLCIRSTALLSKLTNPHDYSYQNDFRDNLTTLLGGSDVIDAIKQENKARICIFNDDTKCVNQRPAVKFVSPYERYKRTTEFILAQEEKEREKEEKKKEEPIRYIPKEERHLEVKVEEKSKSDKMEVKEEEIKEVEIIEEITEVEKVKEPTKIPDDVPWKKKSQSSSNQEFTKALDNPPWKRKTESLSEQISNKKATKNYENARSIVESDKPERKPEVDDFPKLESDHETIVEEKTDKPATGKAKKRKKVDTTKSDFVAYDYSAGNYTKFSTGTQKNVKALLSSKIMFGANKNKKNRKNVRQGAAGKGKK